ncbi:30S ribosomal protein S30e [Candidatus Bathyarchaeota archaeon]|nr:30S ribosomal protein S30e [Candidatus Bathyarchaeota archaeon]
MPTHGSLTKAGKVRSQTPQVEKTVDRSSPGPRRKNRRLYLNRIVTGQDKRYSRRRR